MQPLARIELGSDAPAEVIRLLPLVGLEPVGPAGSASSSPTSTGAKMPDATYQAKVRVEFDTPRSNLVDTAVMAKAGYTQVGPTTLRIAFDSAPREEQSSADFATDSAHAAVCFILSHALGLASPFLTANKHLFDVICVAIAIARGSARILVEGEIGVGKKSLMKLIYAASCDFAGMAGSGGMSGLIHAECAGLEADAVEAEIAPLLAQAARSDSARMRVGGGTIFFNRLGELSLAAQRTLLDLLHTFSVPVPDLREALDPLNRNAIANLRILAASTRPLALMVADGALLPELHDLFDVTLTISPLRARRGDLPLLVRHYMRGLDPALTLNAAALRALSVYPFPGNVLELINFVTRIAIIPPQWRARRSAIGNSATGHPAKNIVRRAEVISQLERGSLNAVWRSRQHWDSGLKHQRRTVSAPTFEPPIDEAGLGKAPLYTPPVPAPIALRLTTMHRLRKPRGGHHRPA